MIALLDAQKENADLVDRRLFAVCCECVARSGLPTFRLSLWRIAAPAVNPHSPILRGRNFDHQSWLAEAIHHYL